MSILQDPYDGSSPAGKREYLHHDEYMQAEYPAIFEYLARVVLNDHPRMPSRLVVYFEEEKACLLLTDPYSGQILFHHDEGFQEALTSLERRLQKGTTDWRRDKKARHTR